MSQFGNKIQLFPGTKVTPQVLLARRLEEADSIEQVVVVTFNKDGSSGISWSNMSRGDIVVAGALLNDAAMRNLKGEV